MNRRSVAEHNALASVLDTMPPTRLTAGFPPLPDEAGFVDGLPTQPAEPAWPMPMLGGVAPPELQPDALPGWLGEFVGALCAATQTPATMAVGVALSVLATCVQRRYVVREHDGYAEPASLWSLTVAPSGSRKSAVLSALAAPLEAWEKRAADRMRREIAANNARIAVAEAAIKRLQGQAGKSDDPHERESLRKQIEDEMANTPERLFSPRAFVNDATVERLQMVLVEQGGRASVLTDEAGLFTSLSSNYGGAGGPALDVLLSGHSGGDVRVERASRQAYVARAAVTLGLMLQPDLLNEAAGSNRFKASGLLARFLFFVPGPFVGGRNVRRFTPVPSEVRDRYARCIDELLPEPMDGPHLPPTVVSLDEQALELWFDFAQECETGLAEGGALSAVADFGAKLAGTAARVALLFELVEAGPKLDAVGFGSMARAIELCRQLVPHAHAAFRLLAADEAERDADHVLQWVVREFARQGGLEAVRQSEIHAALHGRFSKRERLVAALQRLQGNGCLRHTTVKNQGARASDVWLINPRLFP
jgi:putative DNA primase/helicase